MIRGNYKIDIHSSKKKLLLAGKCQVGHIQHDNLIKEVKDAN